MTLPIRTRYEYENGEGMNEAQRKALHRAMAVEVQQLLDGVFSGETIDQIADGFTAIAEYAVEYSSAQCKYPMSCPRD